MRICFYLENYVAGGVDAVLVNTINNWPDDDDEILLVCNPTNKGLEKILTKDISRKYKLIMSSFVLSQDVSYVVQNPFIKTVLRFLWYYGEYVLYINYMMKLKKMFTELNPDVIFIHNGGYPGADTARMAVIGARLAGIKKVFMVIHNLAFKVPPLKKIPEYIIDRLIDKNAEIVCVSKKGEYELKLNRFFYDDVVVIHNGVEGYKCKLPEENISKATLNLCENDAIIGMVGALDEKKGHAVLFKALKILKDNKLLHNTKCLIVGEGKDEIQIRKIIHDYGLDDVVHLCGFVTSVMEYYSLFDVLVLPSKEYESCPMVILEAMSAGVPVIATNTGGVDEIVIDGCSGYIVPRCNPERLAEAIESILMNPQLRTEMGEEGKKRFLANFKANKMAKKYYELMKS